MSGRGGGGGGGAMGVGGWGGDGVAMACLSACNKLHAQITPQRGVAFFFFVCFFRASRALLCRH